MEKCAVVYALYKPVSYTHLDVYKRQYYANAETADTHRWALVLHGYRGDYTGALQLAAPYYEAGYQVIADVYKRQALEWGTTVGNDC